jgi:hypothetical protein
MYMLLYVFLPHYDPDPGPQSGTLLPRGRTSTYCVRVCVLWGMCVMGTGYRVQIRTHIIIYKNNNTHIITYTYNNI